MKKSYMDRLARWALWRLPREEAESVIADYQDITNDPPGSKEELVRRLGKPQDVIELLTDSRPYTIWLGVFLLLSLCALAPCFSDDNSSVWVHHFDLIGYTLSVLGTLGVLLWFRRYGKKEQQLPKALPIVLAVLGIWCGGVVLFNWLWMRDPLGYVQATEWLEPYIGSVTMVITTGFRLGSIAAALAGVWGLVKARTGDRRWIAVYIMALAAVLLMIGSLLLMRTLSDIRDGWYWPYLWRYIIIFIAGLLGMGVALC